MPRSRCLSIENHYTCPVAEELFYQENDAGLYVLAKGHMTASVSTDLKDLIQHRLSQGPVPPTFSVDLSGCEYMDSTFMGLLVGFHKRYKALTGRALTIQCPSRECVALLGSLGILRILNVSEIDNKLDSSAWIRVSADQDPTTSIVYGAHQDLSEISPENATKFAALQSVLKSELEKKTPQDEGNSH